MSFSNAISGFDTAFGMFLDGARRIRLDYMQKNFATLLAAYPNEAELGFEDGKRYVRVVAKGSVWGFVDKTTGDVLKAASFKTPAKHARGNIFDAQNGLATIGPYGPAYLR